MFKIEISTQTENHKEKKNVVTDKSKFLKKWMESFQTRNWAFYTKYHYTRFERNIFKN